MAAVACECGTEPTARVEFLKIQASRLNQCNFVARLRLCCALDALAFSSSPAGARPLAGERHMNLSECLGLDNGRREVPPGARAVSAGNDSQLVSRSGSSTTLRSSLRAHKSGEW